MSRNVRGVRPHGPGGGLPPIQSARVGRGNSVRVVLPTPPEWTARALCAQTDPDAFFPDKGGSTREAKAVCAGCEVQPECLAYALARRERFGIWGGKSERERRRLLRRQYPTTTQTPERRAAA